MRAWEQANGWREVFTRVFAAMELKYNIYPEWLINPQTGRRLKLDLFCPTVNLAIRLEGLHNSKTPKRLSLEEEAQKRTRDDARFAQCKAHGVELVVINIGDEDVMPTFRDFDLCMSRIKHRTEEQPVREQISQARGKAMAIATKLRHTNTLKNYADLWSDRQYRIPTAAETTTKPPPQFETGMDVEHTVFGLGTVVSATPSGDDTILTVEFLEVGAKTLAASLLANKMTPL